MFKLLARLVTHHPWLVCGAWIIAAIMLTWRAPDWDSNSHDDDIRSLPDRCASVRGYHLLEQSFPQDVFASRAIFAVERIEAPLTAADFALVDKFVEDIEHLRHEPELKIGNITSHRDGLIGTRLTSADGHCTLIQVALGTPYLALQTRATLDRIDEQLHRRLAEAGPTRPRLLTTGAAGLGRDLIKASADSLDHTTLATVILVVVVLLLVYRSPLLALVPLATIALSVWVSLRLLAMMTQIPGVQLASVSRIFTIVILYGAGTDYCLFLISRYREELAQGYPIGLALRRSIQAVGGALAASAGTVICGLSMMGFAEFAKVRSAGPAIALGLAVALIGSLTLAPTFLYLLGRAVFWPGRVPGAVAQTPPGQQAEAQGSLWERISRGVAARPAWIWGVSVLVLAPLALLGMHVTPGYRPTGELSQSVSSVQGLAVLQRHFTAGETGPVTVLLVSQTDWNSPEGRDAISHLSHGFAQLDGVAEVRSLTQPLGKPLPVPAPTLAKGFLGSFLKSVRHDVGIVLEQANQRARDYYVAKLGDEAPRYVTRLDVVLHSDPFAPASAGTLELLETWLRDELQHAHLTAGISQAECYGITVQARDLSEIAEHDRVRVNVLVLAGILLILFVLVRKPWLAVYLLVTVLFSYYATLGATVLAGWIWTGHPLFEMDWRVPFFLFTILAAVGEDYNIFLVTRILQEKKQHGIREGTRLGLARTGGTITACGLVMAGTFATLMLGGLGTLVQVGFALAFGVLLDTFVVRPFLVPAFMLLVWKEKAVPQPTPDVWQKAIRALRRAG